MNLLLIGATGRVGMSVIEYGLAAGHHIIAVVRNPSKIQQTHPQLSVVAGDVYQPETLTAPMAQKIDAVLNVVGGDVFKPSNIVTDSARALLQAMQTTGVKRYLGITGVAEMESCSVLGKFTQTALRLSPIRHAVRDHDGAFGLVKAANCTWTLAGCPYIRDGQHTGAYQHKPDCFPGGFKTISPQDVADFLVKEVKEQRYTKQIVGIWY